MMRTIALALALAAGAASWLLLPGRAPAVRGGPPPVRTWKSACAGKPSVPLGTLQLTRTPAADADEAWVQAAWQRGAVGEAHRLEVLLPAGATLLEGPSWQALPEGLQGGTATWRVRFPTTCTSDLVVRMHAQVDGGAASREACLRLWECE